MNLIYSASFGQVLINWLKDHLLPCPFKYLTHIDCPGCGFQRAVVFMLQGNLADSFKMYPPAIPIILAFAYLFADRKFNLDRPNGIVKKSVYMVVATFILVCYCLKMWHLYAYKAVSA